MATEEKPPQAPAGEAAPEVKPEVKPTEQPAKLQDLSAEQLQELYKKSPDLFKGIITPPPKPPEPPSFAQAKEFGIEVPADVPVNEESVNAYLAHAKKIGLSKEQVQAEINWQASAYRASAEAEKKVPEQNLAALKADKVFGKDFDTNMQIAKKALLKFGDAEVAERAKSNDPVTMRMLLRLGQADAEDGTPRPPGGGGASDDAATLEKQLQDRYPNSPQLFNRS